MTRKKVKDAILTAPVQYVFPPGKKGDSNAVRKEVWRLADGSAEFLRCDLCLQFISLPGRSLFHYWSSHLGSQLCVTESRKLLHKSIRAEADQAVHRVLKGSSSCMYIQQPACL